MKLFAPGLFTDQVALITGGGSGIGLAIAQELGSLGCRIAICGRNPERLEAGRSALDAAGVDVLAMPCDIRKPDEVEPFVDAILARFGRLDHLVNNAGGQFPSPAEAMSYKGWRAVIENNLDATFLVTQTVAVKAMLPAGSGHIVSIVANMWRGFPGMAHTGAARAGVVNMTQSLAVEWASRGLTVNAVAPGIVKSTGTERYPPEFLAQGVNATPIRRMGTPEEVAHAVTFLLSPAGAWITGETLCIDGGGRLFGDTWPFPSPK